jgi:hypothetical protein
MRPDLVGELREARIDWIEAPLQRNHELYAGLLAPLRKFLRFAHAGRERLLFEYVHVILSDRFDHRSPDVMRNEHQPSNSSSISGSGGRSPSLIYRKSGMFTTSVE